MRRTIGVDRDAQRRRQHLISITCGLAIKVRFRTATQSQMLTTFTTVAPACTRLLMAAAREQKCDSAEDTNS